MPSRRYCDKVNLALELPHSLGKNGYCDGATVSRRLEPQAGMPAAIGGSQVCGSERAVLSHM
jgi:hypothetical protein